MGRLIRNGTQFGVGKMPQVSNPNLLDNPFFTVNQRQGKIAPIGTSIYADSGLSAFVVQLSVALPVVELTSAYAKVKDTTVGYDSFYYCRATDVVDGYVGAWVYSVDRWLISAPNGAKINKGIELSPDSAISQRLPLNFLNDLLGKTITISFKIYNEVYSVGGILTDRDEWQLWSRWVATSNGNVFVGINRSVELGFWNLMIQASPLNNTDIHISATKLELGTVSTLANEVALDYGTELLKCQRYYQVINRQMWLYTRKDGVQVLSVPFTTTMRTTPVITFNSNNNTVIFEKASEGGASFYSADINVDGVYFVEANADL